MLRVKGLPLIHCSLCETKVSHNGQCDKDQFGSRHTCIENPHDAHIMLFATIQCMKFPCGTYFSCRGLTVFPFLKSANFIFLLESEVIPRGKSFGSARIRTHSNHVAKEFTQQRGC